MIWYDERWLNLRMKEWNDCIWWYRIDSIIYKYYINHRHRMSKTSPLSIDVDSWNGNPNKIWTKYPEK